MSTKAKPLEDAPMAPAAAVKAMLDVTRDFQNLETDVKLLRARGVEFIGPEEGLLACGYEGLGRLWNVDDIVERAAQLLAQKK